MAFKRKRTFRRRRRNPTYKKKRKLVYRKNRRFKRRGTGAVQRSMPSANFLPPKCMAVLTYKHQHTLDGGQGTQAQYAYSANGAYDPDQSGTGQALPGWATYADFYSYYCVIASHMTVTVLQNGTQGSILSIELNDLTNATTTAIRDMWMSKNFRSKILTANNEKVHVLKKGFSIKKATAISSPLTHLPLQATTNQAPSWHFRYYFVHQGTTSSLDPGYCTYMCTIKYRIIFLTPKIQTQQ